MDGHLYNRQLQFLMDKINHAKAIIVGAGLGMSLASGFRHCYEEDAVFEQYFSKFRTKYGYMNTSTGAFYPYESSEEKWAFLARLLRCVRERGNGSTYEALQQLLEGRNYHILTTNQDGQFERLFPAQCVSAIQGNMFYLQCGRGCHDKLYESLPLIEEIDRNITADLKIPSTMIPRCPKCNSEMRPWVRSFSFLEGEQYHEEHRKLNKFLKRYEKEQLLLLELGVGNKTPTLIREPFWSMTYNWPKTSYISINIEEVEVPPFLHGKSMMIQADLEQLLWDVNEKMEKCCREGKPHET